MVDGARPLLSLAALTMSIVLSGCATLQPIPLQPLAINMPSDPVRIYWLHAYQVGSGIRVVGTVRPSRGVYRAGRGHIDVTAMFSDRRDPQTIATRPGPSSRRGQGSRSFSAFMAETNYQDVERISVRYHEDWPHVPDRPSR